MSDHQEADSEANDEESTRDSRLDALSAVILILLAVAACAYFVGTAT